jgi:hypothetical protein
MDGYDTGYIDSVQPRWCASQIADCYLFLYDITNRRSFEAIVRDMTNYFVIELPHHYHFHYLAQRMTRIRTALLRQRFHLQLLLLEQSSTVLDIK